MSHIIDERFLCQILSGRLPGSVLDSLSPGEWEAVVRKAQEGGVAPYLHWTLSESGAIASLPKPLANSLRAMYVGTRMNNEQTVAELEVLSAHFHRAGVPGVALKGMCFALTIYPDIGTRPMVDLDILVSASQASDAVRIAGDLGYKQALPEASPGLDRLLNHAAPLQKTRRPFTTLELHTRLVAGESFTHAVPVDWFWGQTEPVTDRRFEHLLMLTPTAQLLYACAHAMLQHGGRYASLRWLFDLDRLVRACEGSLDWDLFLWQARAFEWSSAADAALARIVELFETPVPGRVLEALAGVCDRNSERVNALGSPPVTHTLEEYDKLRALSWRGRIRLALALALPGAAYMRWRYGARSTWSLPGWYLYRWWGILKDVVGTVLLVGGKVVAPRGRNGGKLEGSTQKR